MIIKLFNRRLKFSILATNEVRLKLPRVKYRRKNLQKLNAEFRKYDIKMAEIRVAFQIFMDTRSKYARGMLKDQNVNFLITNFFIKSNDR